MARWTAGNLFNRLCSPQESWRSRQPPRAATGRAYRLDWLRRRITRRDAMFPHGSGASLLSNAAAVPPLFSSMASRSAAFSGAALWNAWQGSGDVRAGPDGAGLFGSARGAGPFPSCTSRHARGVSRPASIPAVDLIANDSGGTVAQLLMAQHPRRIRTVILTDCDVHENSPPPQMRNSSSRLATECTTRNRATPGRSILCQISARHRRRCLCRPRKFQRRWAIDYSLRPLIASPLRRAQLNRYLAAFEPNPLVAIKPLLEHCNAPTRMVWERPTRCSRLPGRSGSIAPCPNPGGVRLVDRGRLFWPEEHPDLLAAEARTLWSI